MMKQFNLIPKLVRITTFLCVALFIIITIPLLSGSISPPSDSQSVRDYGLNKADIAYLPLLPGRRIPSPSGSHPAVTEMRSPATPQKKKLLIRTHPTTVPPS